MASQPRHRKPDQEFPARHERAGTRRRPAHIHRIRAGERSRGVTTPVSLVYLPVSLTGPGPSGSTEPARLCRGCSHLPGRPPGSAASSFTPPLRRQGDGGLSPPSEPAAPRGATCCLSATGIRFLGHPAPAGELSLPHGRPTGHHRVPDPNGVVVLHMNKLRPGRALPLSRGRWCAPGQQLSPGRHLPLFHGQSLRPHWNIPSAGGTFTRRHQEFTHSPITPGPAGCRPRTGNPHTGPRRSSPRPPPPDGTGTASASAPGFAPRGYPRRTPGRRQAITHWPGYYTPGLSRASNGASHLNSCTLTSHVIAGCLHHHCGHLPAPQPVRQRQHLPPGGAEAAGLGRPPRRVLIRGTRIVAVIPALPMSMPHTRSRYSGSSVTSSTRPSTSPGLGC